MPAAEIRLGTCAGGDGEREIEHGEPRPPIIQLEGARDSTYLPFVASGEIGRYQVGSLILGALKRPITSNGISDARCKKVA